MRRIMMVLCLVLLLSSVAVVQADQVKVNIVYPINGSTVPITDPGPMEIKSAYFTASFGATFSGGPHKAEWGFDNTAVGSASFYDMISVQFVHKLPAGKHIFWVKTDFGGNKVSFKVGK